MALHRTDAHRRLWLLIATVAACTTVWMSAAGLTLAWRSTAVPIAACLALEAAAAFYTFGRPEPRLAATLSSVAQLIAFCAIAACLSYAVAATAGPLWDADLLAWDRLLGLDWRGYLDAVNRRPWLGLIYTVAYQSLQVQLLAVALVLGFGGHLQALQRFLRAFICTGLATILISGLMPAMAMYATLHLQPADFAALHPAAAFVHVASMTGLRDGSLRVLTLSELEGIITFPSLHAALGVLLALAFWPVRWIRWPALALNLVLIAATPIDGGHYFSDVLAGTAIACLAYRLAGIRGASLAPSALLLWSGPAARGRERQPVPHRADAAGMPGSEAA